MHLIQTLDAPRRVVPPKTRVGAAPRPAVDGDNDDKSIRIRALYAKALYRADGATLDDVRESVETLEDTERTARRVLGGAHPVVGSIELFLRNAREELAARETPSASA